MSSNKCNTEFSFVVNSQLTTNRVGEFNPQNEAPHLFFTPPPPLSFRILSQAPYRAMFTNQRTEMRTTKETDACFLTLCSQSLHHGKHFNVF